MMFVHGASIECRVFLWLALGFLGACSEQRLLVVNSEPSETDSATEDEADGMDCPEQLLIGESGSYWGELNEIGEGNGIELGFNSYCWRQEPHVSDGPNQVWKILPPSAQQIIVTIREMSLIGPGCELLFYVLRGCDPDDEADCSENTPLCVGDLTCRVATVIKSVGAEIKYSTNDLGRGCWLVFDTQAGCSGSYSFDIEIQ